MNRIKQLNDLGQSIWFDNIQRLLLDNGEMEHMIEQGEIRGVTSNPSIFQNAIAKTSYYDEAIKPLARQGWQAEQIFWQLAVEDIRAATDLFRPVYEDSNAGDGYVSLEVSPLLANDTEQTIAEARRLWDWVNRPNLMIKIPATRAGLTAIRTSIAAGININVTLIFSLTRYAEVIEAYLAGLEDRKAAGLPIDRIASVASFFVSRIDSKVDGYLQQIIHKEGSEAAQATQLLGQTAIANARLAYQLFLKEFGASRFKVLEAVGAKFQRPLWASTSTKNPAYRDVIYVEDLVGKNSVNTVPPQTLDAFRDHGVAAITIETGKIDPQSVMDGIESVGIEMGQVTQELEDEGVKAFMDAFTGLIKTIDQRRISALAE
jgi:transaldolase